MQIEIISFTEQGSRTAEKIEEIMEGYHQTQESGKTAGGQSMEQSRKMQSSTKYSSNLVQRFDGRKLEQSLQNWCQNAFSHAGLLIFIGAAGIAVRTIAPFLKDKFTDPAVLVVDERADYVIPLLSGHVGGANEYAAYLAEHLSAAAVITTATDLNGKFAVDLFARKNQLVIRDRTWAKEISAAILRGGKVGVFCEGDIIGNLPEELFRVSRNCPEKRNDLLTEIPKTSQERKEALKKWEAQQISIGIHTSDHLIPKAVTLGIGCRKGKAAEKIEQFVLKQLEGQQIALESISCVASADRKKEEPGILAFCKKYKLDFQTFSTEQLKQVPGEFAASAFVEETIGVGNVCERAAVCGQRGEAYHVILPKTAENGMTLAIVEKEWSVTFE